MRLNLWPGCTSVSGSEPSPTRVPPTLLFLTVQTTQTSVSPACERSSSRKPIRSARSPAGSSCGRTRRRSGAVVTAPDRNQDDHHDDDHRHQGPDTPPQTPTPPPLPLRRPHRSPPRPGGRRSPFRPGPPLRTTLRTSTHRRITPRHTRLLRSEYRHARKRPALRRTEDASQVTPYEPTSFGGHRRGNQPPQGGGGCPADIAERRTVVVHTEWSWLPGDTLRRNSVLGTTGGMPGHGCAEARQEPSAAHGSESPPTPRTGTGSARSWPSSGCSASAHRCSGSA